LLYTRGVLSGAAIRVRNFALDVVLIFLTLALGVMCTGTWFNWRRDCKWLSLNVPKFAGQSVPIIDIKYRLKVSNKSPDKKSAFLVANRSPQSPLKKTPNWTLVSFSGFFDTVEPILLLGSVGYSYCTSEEKRRLELTHAPVHKTHSTKVIKMTTTFEPHLLNRTVVVYQRNTYAGAATCGSKLVVYILHPQP